MSLLNKIKQQFRALYEKKPEMLVSMFRVAMYDALTYNQKSGEGGMDGTAVKLLADEDDPKMAAALAEIKRIYKELGRQTQITYADVIAYAGAVAIEATGTQFTCFTSTKVQILTPEELQGARAQSSSSGALTASTRTTRYRLAPWTAGTSMLPMPRYTSMYVLSCCYMCVLTLLDI